MNLLMGGLFCVKCNCRWDLSNNFIDFSIGIPLVLRNILCHILRFLVPLLPSVQVSTSFIHISLQLNAKFPDIFLGCFMHLHRIGHLCQFQSKPSLCADKPMPFDLT